jgi:hypothetical protein
MKPNYCREISITLNGEECFTPLFLGHFSGPLHEPCNLLDRYVRKSIPAPQSLGFRRLLLAESENKEANARPISD